MSSQYQKVQLRPHSEFDNRVKVHEIVDSEFPGYVHLVSSYLLTECIDDDKYNAVECEHWYWDIHLVMTLSNMDQRMCLGNQFL